ncbi:RAB GTPase homolog A1F [Actinidia rufa]|uniref:RAB GTPase homolog A1F n=1 Tax=Actinidia rufa TaxID=165716 RepID=A0A7J0E0E4_9ERIC|nr:RAB GTPase homolog A1F [Actinidia rufa]
MYDVTRYFTFKNIARWLKELRDHTDANIMRGRQGVCRERTTSSWRLQLESLNVDAFTEVCTQIYQVVRRKALNIGDDPVALPKGMTINVGIRDDV